LFVRVNVAVADVSPTASALPNAMARLRLWPKLDFARATSGVEDFVEVAEVGEVHPAAAIATSTRPPNHLRDLPPPSGRRVSGSSRSESVEPLGQLRESGALAVYTISIEPDQRLIVLIARIDLHRGKRVRNPCLVGR
jgi:hypothetical protein